MKAEIKYIFFIIIILLTLILCDKLTIKLYWFALNNNVDILYNVYLLYVLIGIELLYDEVKFNFPNKYIDFSRAIFGSIIFIILYLPKVINTFPMLFSQNYIAPVIVASYFIFKAFAHRFVLKGKV